MSTPRCPGQNQQYWTFDDLYDVPCPFCSHEIEFWKDEPIRFCPNCKEEVRNPRINLGCAKWCPHAEQCLGRPLDLVPDSVFDRLIVLIKRALNRENRSLRKARICCEIAEKEAAGKNVSLCVVKASALMVGAAMTDNGGIAPLPEGHDILFQSGLNPDHFQTVEAMISAFAEGRILNTPEYEIVAAALGKCKCVGNGNPA